MHCSEAGHILEYFDLKSHLVLDNVRAADYVGCFIEIASLTENSWSNVPGGYDTPQNAGVKRHIGRNMV